MSYLVSAVEVRRCPTSSSVPLSEESICVEGLDEHSPGLYNADFGMKY